MFKRPTGSWAEKLYWYFMWPGNLLFFITVPDVRRGGRWKSWYPFSFVVCIAWIGSLSYLVTWFITVIGNITGHRSFFLMKLINCVCYIHAQAIPLVSLILPWVSLSWLPVVVFQKQLLLLWLHVRVDMNTPYTTESQM